MIAAKPQTCGRGITAQDPRSGEGKTRKATPITKFDPKNLDALRPVIDKALRVLQKYGLTATIGKITYSDTNFSTKLEVTTSNNGESEFKKYASMFQLKPAWFGKTFQDGENTFEIIGLDQARPRFPVEVRNTATQKVYSYTADGVRRLLGDHAEVEKEHREQFVRNWQWLENDKSSDLQSEWLGKQIVVGADGTSAIVLGLDKEPWGSRKANVVIDVNGLLRTASMANFMAIIRRYNRKLLKAA